MAKTTSSAPAGGEFNPDTSSKNPPTSADQPALDGPVELPTGPLDKLDLSKFRISQESYSSAGARLLNGTIRVGKPAKDAFFRTHPDAGFWLEAGLIEYRMEYYLVSGELYEALGEEPTLTRRMLVPAITKAKSVFVWPLKAEVDNTWARTAHEAAALARVTWVRIKANREAGGYETYGAVNQGDEPDWTDMTLANLLEVAFRGRIIDSFDHPVLRALRGE